ncbi:hypothetical protein FRB99_000530 [Tulasnella sp. 403]|nr:hypothetical protein FRB99_000530 [Tulasnella sp. 403]
MDFLTWDAQPSYATHLQPHINLEDYLSTCSFLTVPAPFSPSSSPSTSFSPPNPTPATPDREYPSDFNSPSPNLFSSPSMSAKSPLTPDRLPSYLSITDKIKIVIQDSEKMRLPSREIVEAISRRFVDNGMKLSDTVRHHLSNAKERPSGSKVFLKIDKPEGRSGKGDDWTLNDGILPYIGALPPPIPSSEQLDTGVRRRKKNIKKRKMTRRTSTRVSRRAAELEASLDGEELQHEGVPLAETSQPSHLPTLPPSRVTEPFASKSSTPVPSTPPSLQDGFQAFTTANSITLPDPNMQFQTQCNFSTAATTPPDLEYDILFHTHVPEHDLDGAALTDSSAYGTIAWNQAYNLGWGDLLGIQPARRFGLINRFLTKGITGCVARETEVVGIAKGPGDAYKDTPWTPLPGGRK